MKVTELEQATKDLLAEMLTPGLRSAIDKMLSKGASVPQVREVLTHTVRRIARKEHSFTELSILEYLDQVEAKKVPPAAAPPTKEK